MNTAQEISRGLGLVLEPVCPVPCKSTLAGLAAVLATMETLDEDFPEIDEGLPPLDDVEL